MDAIDCDFAIEALGARKADLQSLIDQLTGLLGEVDIRTREDTSSAVPLFKMCLWLDKDPVTRRMIDGEVVTIHDPNLRKKREAIVDAMALAAPNPLGIFIRRSVLLRLVGVSWNAQPKE